MAYDNTETEIQHPNTVFRQPETTTVVAPEQKQALATGGVTEGQLRAQYDAAVKRYPQTEGKYESGFYNSEQGAGKRPQGESWERYRARAADILTPQGGDFSAPAGSRGQSQGAMTVQSEPTPHTAKPPIDPRPWAWVQKNNPQIHEWIENASNTTGVSPERIAAHMYEESRFNPKIGRGGDGEIGPMQMLPSTAAGYTANGRLDPFQPQDNVLMGALYMRDLDNKYGKDSFTSVARYNGSGPKAVAYARRVMPTAPESAELQLHNKEGSMDPAGLVRAGVQGGPDGFFRYAVSTAPSGLPMSDVWRQAEASLVGAMIAKGDMAGAQHARDFVLQMSHQGTNMNLMAAHQALQAGNGKAAADLLAKAHAFFPDGTIGRFRTDGKNVWAETTDENNPGTKVGPSFQVTPDKIAGMLNQTTDPQQYLKTLTEMQKAASQARLAEQHGDYYAGAAQRSADKNATSILTTRERTDATRYAADKRLEAAALKQGGPDKTLSRQVDKETEEKFAATRSDLPPEQNSRAGGIYHAVRMGGATPPEAEAVAKGLTDGSLLGARLPDGRWGIVNKDKPGQVIQYLPPGSLDKFAPPQQPQPSPVGAGATSALGAQQTTSNLAGTVPVQQSSAMPMRG